MIFYQVYIEYLLDFYENTISLKDILEKSGAKIVNDKENIDDEDNIDIDLSPEVLEKDSILNLLK